MEASQREQSLRDEISALKISLSSASAEGDASAAKATALQSSLRNAQDKLVSNKQNENWGKPLSSFFCCSFFFSFLL